MRLSKEERKLLKRTLAEMSKEAELYLFGSRVDDRKRGGDIDLLVVDKRLSKKDLRKLRIEFCKHFGEQKIDIVLDNGKVDDPFITIAREGAVPL
ncbi:nucleotidyltransferase domain-containing protein [Nitratifractor salsuginis]|uniref:DNA polymerase beta domain protein region n=1 Tax=Nitratifractor salsuginis (strain DSM 16511 / JCM 12458 / E9I37-1) TaxID=749222 RepID=E6X069_NITSE|nr:nucleotidyltransferase domain-containing protein [Nitratifractor salsuginis]ADV46792.1 DNA polymerase beta domain protein region [Nitratifractor salsuginis DSM 16511]